MKKNYIHTTCTLVLLGMIVAGLWGCQTDDLAEQATASQGALQLTVIDNGYTTGQAVNYENGTLGELPQTRATENDYKTTFTKDDKIGLYAVKGGSLVTTATNIRLTLTDIGSGTLQWQPDAGVKLPTDANYYFAYYPYQTSPNGTLNNSATTADAFFSDIISAWTPATDQSGTSYTQQDLMVGGGVLSSNKLTITLAHKMGLAVIKLPTGATDAKVKGFTLYSGVSGEYRYLLKPNTTPLLEGSFIDDSGNSRGYAITAASTAEGQYKTYTVKGKPAIMSFGIDLTLYPSDMTYILPFKTTGVTGNYDLTVNWGDGSQATNIPAGTDLTTAISHTYADAKEYTIAISTTEEDSSKEQIPGFRPGSHRTTSNNKLKLKSLPTPLFNTGETDFLDCFKGCTNLTGSIPENLFINNPQVKILKNCFRGCSGLTGSIPENLFANNPLVEDFNSCISDCTNLTGAIPAGLFAHNPEVTTFYYVFYNCIELTSIPSKLFENNKKAKDFECAFADCFSLPSIPPGLFDNNLEATTFLGCFSLTQPRFTSNMSGSIPSKLFAKNLKATNFQQCFQGQTKLLLNSDIFCEETAENKANRFAEQTVNFSYCFDRVGSDSSVSNAGTAPELWSYTYSSPALPKNTAACFEGIGTVTNASSIDNAWK